MPRPSSTAAIREAFLRYFEQQQHQRVASSPLVPGNDATLLFTNAGMVQFKDVFLGDESRDYVRATSSQRCVRAGGKHNDLENVGYTARHHTFFEMLGNFSFGDYFKAEAIPFAWQFLTVDLAIPKDRLWVTVYANDDEAFSIWHNDMGLAEEQIIRIGDNKGAPYASDNFWSMGDTGPCGPCTEIFYDHGEHIEGGLPGTPEEDGDRYIEIWNIVFMQYNRSADGNMAPLPKPAVDTGMGLERIAAVMQGVHSNYEIDLFQALLASTAELLGIKDQGQSSLRVIADHIRSCAFLILDDVMPSNEGRGYVLRRIIRRAVRHGNKLGATDLFFWRLVSALVDAMGEAYPDLVKAQRQIEKALKAEEQQFALTLEQGMKILEQDLSELTGNVIPGDTAFKLYDTYGFPLDLTADIARERDMTIDVDGYDAAMSQQRAQAKAASQFKSGGADKLDLESCSLTKATDFTGYDQLNDQATIMALFIDGKSVDNIVTGQQALIVLDHTPFYAESGGQAGDVGQLRSAEASFDISDTFKQGNIFIHRGQVSEGSLRLADTVDAQVTPQSRQATALNHSATHLLHAALRQVLGDHVTQKGSLVDAQRLRFDFSHPEAMSDQQLAQVANLVNQQVRDNSSVESQVTDMASAQKSGAMALFGEKYGSDVRVLIMGSDRFSVELCGGTHVNRTGDIGLFLITAESGIASGVRRIEAVTGEHALSWIADADHRAKHAASLLKTHPQEMPQKVQQLLDQQKALEKKLQQLQQKLASSVGSDLASQAEEFNGVKLLAEVLDGADPKSLRDTVDQLKQKMGSAVVILAAPHGDKVALVAGVTVDLVKTVKAGDIIKALSGALSGKGGGRPDFAQGAGSAIEHNSEAVNAAIEAVKQQVIEQLN
ncbi:MAG: alanine--tRNA ligase [Pseudomonadales bacterium]|nr:alanine--tRNA ligase [Pseudomonadales bacterium]